MTTERLWRTLAVLLPVLAAVLAPMSTVDLTYHLRAGAETLATGAVPSVDTWTFTAMGRPWVDQQWGAQVILHLAERVGGWTGLVLLRAALTGLIFGCLVDVAMRRGLGVRMAALLVLVAFLVAAPAMALRPQLLGMACFALAVLLIERRRAQPRALWLIPAVVLLWANLHGSFFLGPVVLGLAWMQDLHDRDSGARRTGLAVLASLVAACVTPFGPAVWLYAVGLSLDPSVTDRISEWRPTSLREPSGIVFFASVAAVAVVLARPGGATPWPTLAWLAVFATIGIYAERGVAWWAIAAVGPVAGLLAQERTERRPRPDPVLIRRANAGLVGLLVLAGVALLPAWRPLDPGSGAPIGVLTDVPPGITAYLREHATGDDRILNHQAWGSWFSYVLPQATIAIDSRIELYPPEVWSQYEGVLGGVDGWQEQLKTWGVTIIVLDSDQAAAADRLSADGWETVYRDEDGLILAADAVPSAGGPVGQIGQSRR